MCQVSGVHLTWVLGRYRSCYGTRPFSGVHLTGYSAAIGAAMVCVRFQGYT